MSVSSDDGKLRGSRSMETPIESKKNSGNNGEYGYDAIWHEHFTGRVEPWWLAKYNARNRQRAYCGMHCATCVRKEKCRKRGCRFYLWQGSHV